MGIWRGAGRGEGAKGQDGLDRFAAVAGIAAPPRAPIRRLLHSPVGYRSNTPISTIWLPLASPSRKRGAPRWSVAGAPALLPRSMALLPASRAWVWVGPPLKASGASL